MADEPTTPVEAEAPPLPPTIHEAQSEEAEMKFFTRALIEMGQSQDAATLNRHEELWDEACDRYFQHLEALKDTLPPGLRQRVDQYYLHDAVIRGMGQRGSSLVIVLQLETPPESLLIFTYDLVDPPVIDQAALASQFSSLASLVDWQYDEIEPSAGDPPTWEQSILFSNGWEVRLHFRDVRIEEVQPLLPVPRNGLVMPLPAGFSQSA